MTFQNSASSASTSGFAAALRIRAVDVGNFPLLYISFVQNLTNSQNAPKMIPNTRLYYIFIRLSIWALRAIVPISIAICLGSLAHSLGYGPAIPLPLTIIAYAESIFYVFISVPIQWSLDRDRPRTIERTREERKALFERCWTTIPNFEEFHNVWFKGASLESIHREDLKDLLAWVFFYQTKASLDNDDELEFYIRRTEEKMDWTFPPGRSRNRPMQVSIDALQLQHKPLLFYVVSEKTSNNEYDMKAFLTPYE